MPIVFASGVIPLRPSPSLALWVVAASAAAMGLCLLYLPVLAAVALCGLVVWHGWVGLRAHALQTHPAAIVAVRCEADAFHYQLRAGSWISGSLQPGGLVTRWLTVVRLRDDAEYPQTRVLVLLRDRLAPDHYRQLRVHLRWRRKDNDRARKAQ